MVLIEEEDIRLIFLKAAGILKSLSININKVYENKGRVDLARDG
jgi:hypothetical protein